MQMRATAGPDVEGLNSEQKAAVLAPDGPVLVIAAAGTGKTRALTYRVAYLVGQGVNPARILLLTFTNKASKEMLDRARALAGEAVSGLWGGTFHHLANRILRLHAERIGYGSDFTILDSDDTKRLVRNCIHEMKLPDKQIPKPEVISSMFSLANNTGRPLAAIVAERFQYRLVRGEDILSVHSLYQRQKRAMNAMDFDDLLLNARRLLEENQDIREHYQERFLHVLVDEYQDTNPVQARLVDIMAERHRNLFVVGDDFQSIYSWRGADFRHFLSFPDRYAGTSIFKLETNYRSVPEVLEVANSCIAGNPDQFQKTLRAVREMHKKPRVLEPRDGRDQAQSIIGHIHLLLREGYSPNDIAILYRSHYHAMELQLELQRERIPFVITSGIRFFEQAHIKDVCTLLRLLHNPADEISFTRLLSLLPRVAYRTAAKIWKALGSRFNPLIADQRDKIAELLPAPARKEWAVISGVYQQCCSNNDLMQVPGEIAYDFLNKFYSDYALETFDNAERRIDDIEELIRFIGQSGDLQSFLSEVSLQTNLDSESGTPTDIEAIRLSTVHQAKGLEWSCVFVLWLAEGMFPSRRSMEESEDACSEERRLFYVAATRARDELLLCAPRMMRQRDGSTNFLSPSRFVTELPATMIERQRRGWE